VLLAAARPGSLNDSTALMPPMGNRIESSRVLAEVDEDGLRRAVEGECRIAGVVAVGLQAGGAVLVEEVQGTAAGEAGPELGHYLVEFLSPPFQVHLALRTVSGGQSGHVP
jgi:hypothetical protein